MQKKGKFESGLKTCKVCMKEYREKENMNWSCTQHVNPTYGGEMWWCCGKVGKDAPGCRKTRHISNNEDSESDTDERDKQEKKYVRCTSCKEVGHTIENCKNDPNMKTGGKPEEEYNRIQKMKDFRKLYADSIVHTTHLLKRSVMIPIEQDGEG